MNDDIDRSRVVLSGHEEARERLIDLGRSEDIVDQLEEYTTFYEFAEVVAEAVSNETN